jgi:DNA-binding NtrC family response regulator
MTRPTPDAFDLRVPPAQPGRARPATDRTHLDVFEDPRSQALLAQLERLAGTDVCTLLLGEGGTGKDLLAQALHGASPRREGPFVTVNCGAFPPSQLEAELFGYEKGAFAGAFAATAGWLEAAHGGTVFVDEVERLPLHLQARLLRLLQERQLLRMGARRPQPADVRLIAATADDLERAVRDGRFRDDLYHALQTAALRVPPLRERPGDILPLARHFLAELRRRLHYPPTCFSAEAEQRLLQHAWPGNLRELENVVHHALLMGQGEEIGAELLSLSALPAGVRSAAGAGEDGDALQALQAALQRLCSEAPPDLFGLIERTAVQVAYRHCHLNQLRTAQLLGLSRNVLRARLIEYGEIDARR